MSAPRFDRLDVTPFIDVLLVMLILFMIAVPVPERALGTAVPAPGTGSGPVVRVRVGSEGVWLDGTPVSGPAGLARRLESRFEESVGAAVLVEADDGVPYERVVAVVDAAQGAGRFQVGLVASAPDATTGDGSATALGSRPGARAPVGDP